MRVGIVGADQPQRLARQTQASDGWVVLNAATGRMQQSIAEVGKVAGVVEAALEVDLVESRRTVEADDRAARVDAEEILAGGDVHVELLRQLRLLAVVCGDRAPRARQLVSVI